MANRITGSVKARRVASDIIVHIFLAVVAIVWLVPFIWLLAHSFRGGDIQGLHYDSFLPKFGDLTLGNYINLFTKTESLNFLQAFGNTFFIACCSCLISTFFVLGVSYALSRVKWKLRKPYMNMAMVINLFPGFMSMVAIYFLLKAMGLTEKENLRLALIICYSAGAGTGFYVMKGYMDTIPKALDEAAIIDGATRFQIFSKITIPLSKPIAIYTLLTTFLGAWSDYIFPSMLFGDNKALYTVAIGLKWMTDFRRVDTFYTQFAAGALIVALPIVILFICLQKYYVEGLSGAVKG